MNLQTFTTLITQSIAQKSLQSPLEWLITTNGLDLAHTHQPKPLQNGGIGGKRLSRARLSSWRMLALLNFSADRKTQRSNMVHRIVCLIFGSVICVLGYKSCATDWFLYFAFFFLWVVMLALNVIPFFMCIAVLSNCSLRLSDRCERRIKF